MGKYKFVAPDFDRLLRCHDRNYLNSSPVRKALLPVINQIFEIMEPVIPIDNYGEVKTVWLRVPRGKIEDYYSFEYMKENEMVETYEEYLNYWQEEYPEDYSWYKLTVYEIIEKDGTLRYRGISIGKNMIVSAEMKDCIEEKNYLDDYTILFCKFIAKAAKESIKLLKEGTYNEMVANSLPYKFKYGVVRRSDIWKAFPDYKKNDFDGLPKKVVGDFCKIIKSGVNDIDKINKTKSFTANNFFNACKIGYEACGYKIEPSWTLSEIYLKYADGRDEGLTGTGIGLNEGPGINFDSPKEWDEWYHSSHSGGHTWEIVRGGNSTHVDLYVIDERESLDIQLRLGEISNEEYNQKMVNAGYYFMIAGKHRTRETIRMYLAIYKAGIPVIINDAEELVARLEATDYVGIVPHDRIPKYCEREFPQKYGIVIDFIHIFDDEILLLKDAIEWIKEDEIEIKKE